MPNILVIGSGAREHALAWKFASEKSRFRWRTNVWVAPSNPGINSDEEIFKTFTFDDPDADPAKSPYERMRDVIIEKVKYHLIDCVVIGPEAPLGEGLVDDLKAHGINVFGPTAAAAKLETSKAFAKEIMKEAGVKTAAYEIFHNADDALAYLEKAPHPIVIKADGPASGKGVFVSESLDESRAAIDAIFTEKRFGDAGNSVVIEEFLKGQELSYMVATNGEYILDLPTSRDYKRLLDGNKGPNTGGMGSISPGQPYSEEFNTQIKETIIKPVLDTLRKRGIDYLGFLYAGLILTEDGPYVLEFNVRLGDPETQSVLFSMTQPLAPFVVDSSMGLLKFFPPEKEEPLTAGAQPTCTIVMASSTYPTDKEDYGHSIIGMDDLPSKYDDPDFYIFYSAVQYDKERLGQRSPRAWRRNPPCVNDGGRVLSVTARAETPEAARQKAYDIVSKLEFEGMQYRKDIGE